MTGDVGRECKFGLGRSQYFTHARSPGIAAGHTKFSGHDEQNAPQILLHGGNVVLLAVLAGVGDKDRAHPGHNDEGDQEGNHEFNQGKAPLVPVASVFRVICLHLHVLSFIWSM